MKNQLLALLTTMYAKLGFSTAALEGVAEYLSKTVTEEDKVEAAVKDAEALLKAFQSDADRRATLAAETARKEKAEEEKKKEEATESSKKQEESGKNDDDVPAWAKVLIEQNKTLTTEINTIKAGKTAETRLQQLEAKLEGADEKVKAKIIKDFGRMSFGTDEEFTTYLNETEADIKDLGQSLANDGLSRIPKPVKAGGPPSKEASKEEVDEVMNLM